MSKNSVSFTIALCLLISVFQLGCGEKNNKAKPSFESSVFESELNGPNNSPEVQKQNREIVEKCIASAKLEHITNVTDRDHSYTLKKLKSSIQIKVSVLFNAVDMSEERAQTLLDRANECIPQIRQVWDRYNIDFDLSFDLKETEKRPFYYSNINLLDKVGRSNMSNYYYQGQSGDPEYLRQHLFCTTILHEIGHILSLDDEYPDPDFPNRAFISKEERPWSIMNENYHHLELLDFYPRHLMKIFNHSFCSTE